MEENKHTCCNECMRYGQPFALAFACGHAHKECVRNLIASGCNINKLSEVGQLSPLAIVIANGNLEMVRILLEMGADKNLPIRQFNSAYEWAYHYHIYRGLDYRVIFTNKSSEKIMQLLA